jgi:CRP-like cAMP-binding protein
MLKEKAKKEFRFFNSLSEDELSGLLSFCEFREVPAGENLWNEGDSDNYAAFILSGIVGIKKKTKPDGSNIIVGTYGPGTVIGELCLLTDNARSVTAQVIDSVELSILTSENFEKLISEHPLLGLKLLKSVFLSTCKNMNKTYERIADSF